VLSLSENNGIHKQALIDRKAMTRVYLDYLTQSAGNSLAAFSLPGYGIDSTKNGAYSQADK